MIIDNFKIIEYRFARSNDKYDKKYIINWSRPYEYRFVMDFILIHYKNRPYIHNTSCGGNQKVHNIFINELDKISDCIHSDIQQKGKHPIIIYDITKENKQYENKFDFVLNISTIEHIKDNRLQIIKNLYKQVKPEGYLIMTFEYPKVILDELYPLIKSICDIPDNVLTGKKSVTQNMRAEKNKTKIIYLIIKKINS